MKRYLLVLAAAAALVCGCNKYDAEISDLQDRLDQTELNITNLKSKVEALNTLVDALSKGLTIKSVTPVEGGFTVVFSDASSFTVINGKDGINGENGAPGQDGKDAQVSYKEENGTYIFDFGDGNVITVAKAGAFALKFDEYDIIMEAGAPKEVGFELIGADGTEKFIVESSDYNVEVGDGKLTISAAKIVPSTILFKAIRNSDGATCAVILSVTKKEVENVSIELTVSDISSDGAIIHAVPSNKTAHYLLCVEYPSYANSFDNVEDLYEADMDYYRSKYGSQYASAGYSSFEEFFINEFCYVGDVDDDWTSYLEPETEYVAYAYALDADLSLISSDLAKVEFETLAEAPIEANFIGEAIWHDSIINEWYKLGEAGFSLDLPVDAYEDAKTPGIFYFDSPYGYQNTASWFGLNPDEMFGYEGYLWKEVMIEIDATDPAKVIMPYQDLGISLNPDDEGWISMGSQYGANLMSYGTYSNGIIAFATPRGMLGGLSLDSSLYYADSAGDFMITMPAGSPSSAPCKIKVARKNNKRLDVRAPFLPERTIEPRFANFSAEKISK